jgi:hypothetical protein
MHKSALSDSSPVTGFDLKEKDVPPQFKSRHKELDETVSQILDTDNSKTPIICAPSSDSDESVDNILQEAQRLVCGSRRQEYGNMSECFVMIAELWSDYIHVQVTPHDVCQMMILLKVARGRNGYQRDTSCDIAGYAYCDEVLHK